MWSPSHVQVIVHRAENLLIKGKSGTNNAFVVIELNKESYRTSIKEKSERSIVWNEECELKIPKAGNTANVVLTAYHRNTLGLDQFLGTVKIPLQLFDKFQRTIEWYKLEGKPGKEKGKNKIRGELEVEIGFTSGVQSQSLTSLQTKKKLSFERLTGSLFNLGHRDKRIGVKKFANTLGKVVLNKKKKDLPNKDNLQDNGIQTNKNLPPIKDYNNLDPGVISDDDDDGASHKSSESLGNSLDNPNFIKNITPSIKTRRNFIKNPQISISNWEEDHKKKTNSFFDISQDSTSSSSSRRHSPKLEELQRRLTDRRLSTSCVDFSLLHKENQKPEKKFSSSFNLEKNQIESHKKLSKLARKLKTWHSVDKKDLKRAVVECGSEGKFEEESTTPKLEFKNKNKDELINMVMDLQKRVTNVSVRVKDLEDYLDCILVKVMETVPKILEKS